MKRLLIAIILTVFCALNCFGSNYKLAPQYKTEIEQVINNRYPYVASEINLVAFSAYKMYNKVLKNKNYYMDYVFENFDIQIDAPEFKLYSYLIEITNKYNGNIDKKSVSTDFAGVLYNVLLPYFEANNIDKTRLDALSDLSSSKLKEINGYSDELYKFVYSNQP